MLFHAKNGCVRIGNTDMDYISFGKGRQVLIMLPGLGDGLTTVKGMALTLAWTYRAYAQDYSVFIFSRKHDLPEHCSTRDMAKDQAQAMKLLGIANADLMGISQGGMIAQYLAIDYPELVRKLVLAVTLSRQNELAQRTVSSWISMAERGDYKSLMTDTAEKSYSETYLKKHRWLYPLLGHIGKPKDFSRFLIQADSCLHHNAYPELGKIQCPTLIIGGECDRIVGPDASLELADRIEKSERFMYRGLGHAAYEEAEDFHERVQRFLAD